MKLLLLTFTILLFSISLLLSQAQMHNVKDHYNYIDVNNCLMWVGNNGQGSHNPLTDGSGFFWAKNSGNNLSSIYQDGLVWSGKMNGQIFANGNTHRDGLVGGKIISEGVFDREENPKNRVYKIWKYWETLPPGPKKDKYEKDYLEWPVEDGAPWLDLNDDGIYTVGIDQPKFSGDMTLWFVSNDLDTNSSTFVFGSLPIGLEVQTTVYGFKRNNFLDDVVFKKYKILNKSGSDIEEIQFGYWSDTDLGNAHDDLVGCDTLLNLGYCYNADNDDDDYYGSAPPAVGYKFLDINQTNDQMSSFYGYFHESWHGETDYPQIYYNLMNGLLWNGHPIIAPNDLNITKYWVPGDPVDSSGWFEGGGWPNGPKPSDRRLMISQGPYSFNNRDTIEINVAIIMARGNSHLNSVTLLKEKSKLVDVFYDIYEPEKIEKTAEPLPEYFELKQNYPNPFNPITTIEYSIPPYVGQHLGLDVRLVVYSALGQKVTTLVDKAQQSGNYKIKFDASRLTSGIYFYNITAGSFSQSNKMILLK